MNILIAGSRPVPKIPDGIDHVYYVNGSIYLSGEIKPPPESSHIIAYHCFAEEWEHDCRPTMVDKSVDNLIVVMRDMKQKETVGKKIKEVNYRYKNILFLPSAEKAAITRRAIGKKCLFYAGITKPGSTKNKMSNLKKLVLMEEMGEYKVSTGVFACLYALDKHGRNNHEIILAGIGLDEGTRTHAYNKNYKYRSPHLHFDRIILKKLSRTGNINTTEKDLSDQTGLELYSTGKIHNARE